MNAHIWHESCFRDTHECMPNKWMNWTDEVKNNEYIYRNNDECGKGGPKEFGYFYVHNNNLMRSGNLYTNMYKFRRHDRKKTEQKGTRSVKNWISVLIFFLSLTFPFLPPFIFTFYLVYFVWAVGGVGSDGDGFVPALYAFRSSYCTYINYRV